MDVVAPAHDQERKRADDSRILGLFAIVSNLFCLPAQHQLDSFASG